MIYWLLPTSIYPNLSRHLGFDRSDRRAYLAEQAQCKVFCRLEAYNLTDQTDYTDFLEQAFGFDTLELIDRFGRTTAS